MATTILSLRTALETTLVDALGSYVLANGVRTPAISVRGAGESLPPNTRVQGVECVIVREPAPEVVRQYRNEPTRNIWTLFLVDWSGDASLQEVAALVVSSYPGSTVTVINVPRGVGPRSQMRIDLQRQA
jgi:hypothetical protein